MSWFLLNRNIACILKPLSVLCFLACLLVPHDVFAVSCDEAVISALKAKAASGATTGNEYCAIEVAGAYTAAGYSGSTTLSSAADELAVQLCGSSLSSYVPVTSANINSIPVGALVVGYTYGTWGSTTDASNTNSSLAFLHITHIVVSTGNGNTIGNSSGSSTVAEGTVAGTYSTALASGELYYCMPNYAALGMSNCTSTTSTTNEQTFDMSSCASPTSTLKETRDSLVAALAKSALVSAQMAADITASVRQTDIKKSYCIGNELKLIDWAAIKSMILNLIYQIIMDMVNQVLDYVCTEVQVMVNNVLTKLCVPMPTFGRINLGLSTTGMDACNGTALLTLGTSTGTTVVPLSSLATPITTYFNTLK